MTSGLPRVWFDASYTRTQHGGDIGITRTVRRLFDEFRVLGFPCAAVAFHSQGFRTLEFEPAVTTTTATAPARNDALFRLISGGLARRLVPLALRALPWSWLRPLWQRSSTLAFDALARGREQAAFQPGDIVFMADASWNYPGWEAARRAREQGACVVLLVYDLMPLRHPEFCFPLVPRLYGTWLEEMLRCSDAVVCISRATQQDVQAWAAATPQATVPVRIGHFRLGSDPVASVPSGPVRDSIARFLAQPGACFACVGSIEPKKNHELVLSAFETLWSRGQTPRLVVAGRPTTDSAAVVAAMARHPENGRLLLSIHDATDAEIMALYDRCRALVLASRFEGFGLPLVEARARGCPVIASNLPVFAELADDGVNFFECDSAPSLAAQLQVHTQMDQRALTAPMRPFTWADSARECAALIGKLRSAN